MTKIADELEGFEARRAPASTVTAPVVIERGGKSSHGVLWFLLLVIGLAVLAAAALLLGHRTVTAWMPQSRTIYEEVCTKVPCPGFVWQNANAFRVTAAIEPPVAEAGDAGAGRILMHILGQPVPAADLGKKRPLLLQIAGTEAAAQKFAGDMADVIM